MRILKKIGLANKAILLSTVFYYKFFFSVLWRLENFGIKACACSQRYLAWADEMYDIII